jgi:hypothetical protein
MPLPFYALFCLVHPVRVHKPLLLLHDLNLLDLFSEAYLGHQHQGRHENERGADPA